MLIHTALLPMSLPFTCPSTFSAADTPLLTNNWSLLSRITPSSRTPQVTGPITSVRPLTKVPSKSRLCVSQKTRPRSHAAHRHPQSQHYALRDTAKFPQNRHPASISRPPPTSLAPCRPYSKPIFRPKIKPSAAVRRCG